MKTIEITINPQGQATVQTKGFAGASCREATRLIEQALGVVQSDTPTAELYQSVPNQQSLQQNTGG
jgi:hypothetical protein